MHSVEHSNWASSMSQAQGLKSWREYTLRMERKRYVNREWQNNSFTYVVGEAGELFNRTWVKVVSSTWAWVPGKMPSCHVDKATWAFTSHCKDSLCLGLSTPQGHWGIMPPACHSFWTTVPVRTGSWLKELRPSPLLGPAIERELLDSCASPSSSYLCPDIPPLIYAFFFWLWGTSIPSC